MTFSPDTMNIFSFFLCCLAINSLFSNSISVPSALRRDEIGLVCLTMQDSLQVYEKEYEIGKVLQYDMNFFSNVKGDLSGLERIL